MTIDDWIAGVPYRECDGCLGFVYRSHEKLCAPGQFKCGIEAVDVLGQRVGVIGLQAWHSCRDRRGRAYERYCRAMASKMLRGVVRGTRHLRRLRKEHLVANGYCQHREIQWTLAPAPFDITQSFWAGGRPKVVVPQHLTLLVAGQSLDYLMETTDFGTPESA